MTVNSSIFELFTVKISALYLDSFVIYEQKTFENVIFEFSYFPLEKVTLTFEVIKCPKLVNHFFGELESSNFNSEQFFM